MSLSITLKTFHKQYCLINYNILTRDEYYDCSNLIAYLKSGKDYQLISRRIDEVLTMLNAKENIILTNETARIDMKLNQPVNLTLMAVKGCDLKIGDITATNRTCKSGLPVYVTIGSIHDGYIHGKEIQTIGYIPDEYYRVGVPN